MPIFGGIFIGHRFGAFDSTPSGGRVDDAVGPAFPPAGSYNSTLTGQEYPVAQGGSYVSPSGTTQWPNQICDVDLLNDGSGGTYIDWSTVTNITYSTGLFTEYTTGQLEVPTGSGVYYPNASLESQYQHDGAGSYTGLGGSTNYSSYGTSIFTDNTPGSNYITPQELGTSHVSSTYTYTAYYHDGSGGYYTDQDLSYTSNGVLYGSYSLGTDIFSGVTLPDGNTYYYSENYREIVADGTGGYTYGNDFGQSFPYGTPIYSSPQQTEVPSGSMNYYSNGQTNDYFWDGTGSTPWYYSTVGGSYYSYGNFIYNDGTYDYYWDGNGGYYSV